VSLIEPPERSDDTPAPEEPQAAPIVPIATGKPVKDVCEVCRRPVVELSAGWFHWAPEIDRPECPDYHAAVLAVEAEVAWGHLGMTGAGLVTAFPRGGGLRSAA
jgi:hypothetical protein